MAKKKSLRKISTSKENPFNVKINRNKFSVLGQKVKGTRGLPGISHSVCNAKRKEEFHKKRLLSQKANKFVDKRFMDSSLSFEEQATARLVEERKRKFKKNIFNLNDEESLTHKGLPLGNLKHLGDALNDSDEDEQLDSKFVKQAHFGGFTDDSSSVPKSRKEIIDELIVESKRRKMERKMVKEKNEELIEQLDQKWKAMHHQLIPSMKSKQLKIEIEKKDPFDILLNELKFEMRTAPPQREKSAEEIAKEEKEKQKKLEEERYKRMMNPMDCPESKDNQLSADSLYDGIDLKFETMDEENGDFNINANDISDDDDEESGDESSSEDESEHINNDVEDNEIISVADNDTDFPDTVDKFCALITNDSKNLHDIVGTIIQDKVKNKSKKNIEKLERLFTVILEYIISSKNKSSVTLEVLDVLPHLYTLAGMSPVNTAEKLLTILDDEQVLFQQSKGKKMKKHFPRLQCLALFKIVSAVYSVSDFKHPVVTPSIIFMCDVLSSPYAVSFQNIYSRLYISKIIYDCVSFSKRYVPEVLCFLNKTLKLVLVNSKKFNLFIKNEAFEENIDLCLEVDYKSCNNSEKVKLISEVIELLHQYAVLYEHFDCFNEIFYASMNIINKIVIMDNFSYYPSYLKTVINNFKTFVESVQKTYKPLIFENKKPVPLKLFEPAFESRFARKKVDIQKKRKLIKSVNQKIKKEEKGQLREIRRDNQVIATEKLKEKLEADEERKRKVKQLYQELAVQEGEFKKYTKKK